MGLLHIQLRGQHLQYEHSLLKQIGWMVVLAQASLTGSFLNLPVKLLIGMPLSYHTNTTVSRHCFLVNCFTVVSTSLKHSLCHSLMQIYVGPSGRVRGLPIFKACSDSPWTGQDLCSMSRNEGWEGWRICSPLWAPPPRSLWRRSCVYTHGEKVELRLLLSFYTSPSLKQVFQTTELGDGIDVQWMPNLP